MQVAEKTILGHQANEGLEASKNTINIGPFSVSISCDQADLQASIMALYRYFPLNAGDFSDFRIDMTRPRGLRRWFRPQINFTIDGFLPFKPLPNDQGLALFEWGLNWCITNHCHEYLIVHAAVIEKNGLSMILPAPPGAGKSTLCAALVCDGWRLLSDELALICLDDGHLIVPLCRPVCLKNRSIDIIKQKYPQAEFGPICRDTSKGDVAHMLAPEESVEKMSVFSAPQWIVFPRYGSTSSTSLMPRSKAETYFEIARQSFNFHVLGESGFNVLRGVVDQCYCYDFEYSNLDEAIDCLNTLSFQVKRVE
tara:strand:+ start:3566 stop:4495 length:930 start_codon:yes stop_codon:yes gene_type:complete